MKFIMIYAVLLTIVGILWYSGILLARNIVIAVEKRKPTTSEYIMSFIPILNTVPARKSLYGSAKLPIGVFVAIISTIVVNNLVSSLFANSTSIIAIYIEIFALYGTYISYAVCWIIYGYILMDMAKCLQFGTVTRVVSFILPPLAQLIIGQNCISMMNKIEQDMLEEE